MIQYKSMDIYVLMYLDGHIIMSVDILIVYVDQYTACRSAYCMWIEILYVDWSLCATEQTPYSTSQALL